MTPVRAPRFGRPLVVVLVLVVAAGAASGAYVAAHEGTPHHAGAGPTGRHRHVPRGATRTPARRGRPVVTTTAPPATTTTTAPPATTTTTGPGTLPQTSTLPPAASASFDAAMQGLWRAVATGDVTTALPAFFPEGAYAQLKAIGDAEADYEYRLVGELRLDIGAAHGLLGPGASSAQLVMVEVPEQYAHWVEPGVCENAVGYWEVPNARVVYQVAGAERSFGIASLISWRGAWYVVHLGAVVRPTGTTHGLLDDPATGPGVSAYSSTC